MFIQEYQNDHRPTSSTNLLPKSLLKLSILHNACHRLDLFMPYLLLLFLFMAVEFKVIGQVKDSLKLNPLDSGGALNIPVLIPHDSLLQKTEKGLDTEVSDITAKIKNPVPILKKPSRDSLSKKLLNQLAPGRPFIVFQNGLINYNYAYRSGLDTPFLATNVAQHFMNANANVLIAQKFPLRVSVFERRTNSIYLRNYTDVRVEFNAPEFRRLQSEQLSKYFNELINHLQDPHLKAGMGLQQKLLGNLARIPKPP